MKKKLILIGILIGTSAIIGLGIYSIVRYYKIKNAVVSIELKQNLETEFLSNVKVSDFITNINGKIIDDYTIDTTKIGKKNIKFKYINTDKIKIDYSYTLNIVDKTAPIVWLGDNYTVTEGSDIDLIQSILCGDNYDSNPTCEIFGEYNLNMANTYPLKFKATDSSGNVTEKDFNLNVIPKTNRKNSTSLSISTNFSDVVQAYKSEDTEIGIDISHWQGDVDFEKLKKAGVEFVIIRVGRTDGINGDYVLDTKFTQNIKKANEIGIPVGIYFYSYADSISNAVKDAKWVLKQIKNYKVDLPVAFDWENWNNYNEFNLSFFGLSEIAKSFLDVFEKAGYESLLYSSKNYLEDIWLEMDYPVWLAHYTEKTNYQGDYVFWQICDNGKVDGINGNVDINIRYK